MGVWKADVGTCCNTFTHFPLLLALSLTIKRCSSASPVSVGLHFWNFKSCSISIVSMRQKYQKLTYFYYHSLVAFECQLFYSADSIYYQIYEYFRLNTFSLTFITKCIIRATKVACINPHHSSKFHSTYKIRLLAKLLLHS